MVADGKEYKNRIMVATQNLSLFENSVKKCNIQKMLDDSLTFLETIKNADRLYNNLPRATQISSKNSFNESHDLLQKYFDIRSGIGTFCKCTP